MYTSSTIIFTAIVALARIATATPPACLLAAIGAQTDPSDLKSLCGSLQSSVVGNITEACEGDSLSSAKSVYSATCLSSESVTISFTSSASSSSKTGTSAATTTGSGSGSGSGSSSASQPTGKAGGSSGSKSTGTATATGSAATASSTGQNVGAAITPQNAFVMAPLVLAAGYVGQYLL